MHEKLNKLSSYRCTLVDELVNVNMMLYVVGWCWSISLQSLFRLRERYYEVVNCEKLNENRISEPVCLENEYNSPASISKDVG